MSGLLLFISKLWLALLAVIPWYIVSLLLFLAMVCLFIVLTDQALAWRRRARSKQLDQLLQDHDLSTKPKEKVTYGDR